MRTHLRKLRIKVPESFLRELMSELSRIRCLVQGIEHTTSLHTIYLEVPTEEVLAFEAWLTNASKGEGKVVGNDPVNDQDA